MPVAIAYGGAAVFLVAAFLVAWGLLTVYRLSLKQLLLGIASLFYFSLGAFGVSAGKPLARIGDAITAVADSIDHALAEAVLATEHGIVWLWHALAKQVEYLGQVLGELAETFEAKFRAWYLAFPPLALVWAAVKVAQQLPALLRAAHAAKASVTNVTEKVYKQGATVTNVTKNYITRVVHQTVVATAGAVTAPLPWTRGQIGRLERDASSLREWIKTHGKVLTGAGAAALVGAAIARLGLGWTRCSNVGKTGKRACGMNTDLLESLLADTLLIAGTVSLVEFAQGMQGVTAEVTPLIRDFWRAT